MGKRKRAELVLAKKKQKAKKSKVNPFEVRVNRKKHDVLGQRSKSDRGLPGVSRSRAIQKRKKTLLREYKQRNKTNRFIDHRFGEYDEDLALEEKMMRRFVLEKQRRHERSSIYNLEEEDELTHYGQTIGERESFDEIQLGEGEMEEEDIGETHFGGFLRKKQPRTRTGEGATDQADEKPRSRKEIMEEVVAKSKAIKYERQAEKHEMEELLDKLDTEWKEIQNIVPKAPIDRGASSAADDYDQAVRELAFERRGQPTDRMKSEEELAREEKERLERLEANRIRRMKGHAEGSSEYNRHASADYMAARSVTKKDTRFVLRYEDGKMVLPEGLNLEVEDCAASRKKVDSSEGESELSGDEGEGERSEGGQMETGATEDSDAEEELPREAGDVQSDGEDSESGESEEGERSDGESEEGEENPAEIFGSDLESDEDGGDQGAHSPEEEEEEEEELSEGSESESERGEHTRSRKLSLMELARMREEAAKELPYTFRVPESLRELCTVVDQRSPEECLTAIERIHACNHPTLSPENKQKMERFFSVLVDYCLQLGEDPTTTKLSTLDKLAKPLFKLAQLNSLHTATVFQELLQQIHQRWLNLRRPFQYPPFSDLLLFKFIEVLFPTSDFSHPVVTPAVLFMGQLLSKCQVKDMKQLLHGLFICQLVTEYVALSKRFVPEVVNFVMNTLGCFIKDKKYALYPPFVAKSQLRAQLSVDTTISDTTSPGLLQLMVDSYRSDVSYLVSPQTRCAVLTISLELALQLAELYEKLPSFADIFDPLPTHIESIQDQKWPLQIKDLCAKALDSITAISSRPRAVLQLLKQKPKSIKFYEPKFDEVYAVGRKKAGSKAAGQRQKLKYKVKREFKGAIREIRKDNVFLAKEKLKETLERDAERERKTKQILHDLQTMQHEAKMDKMRKKK